MRSKSLVTPFESHHQLSELKVASDEAVLILFQQLLQKLSWLHHLRLANSGLTHPVVILDCGQHDYVSDLDQNSLDVVVNLGLFLHLTNFSQLLQTFDNLMENYTYHSPIGTIVVEDISTYYWELKAVGTLNKFGDLTEKLHQLRQKVHCNIVMTAWDCSFEKGFNYLNRVPVTPRKLDDISYLPDSLFNGVDRVIYFGQDVIEWDGSKFITSNWEIR